MARQVGSKVAAEDERRVRFAEMNERVRRARLRADGARSPEVNLQEGITLIRFAHKLAAAGARARANR